MKKVLRPPVKEDVVYYSDITGKCFNDLPPVVMKIEFNYGSEYDGKDIELHFTDQEFQQIFDFLKQTLSQDTLKEINNPQFETL